MMLKWNFDSLQIDPQRKPWPSLPYNCNCFTFEKWLISGNVCKNDVSDDVTHKGVTKNGQWVQRKSFHSSSGG